MTKKSTPVKKATAGGPKTSGKPAKPAPQKPYDDDDDELDMDDEDMDMDYEKELGFEDDDDEDDDF